MIFTDVSEVETNKWYFKVRIMNESKDRLKMTSHK